MSKESSRVTVKYMACDEIMTGGEPNDSFERAREAYVKEFCSSLINSITHRQMQDGSYLNSKVVGAENPPYSTT